LLLQTGKPLKTQLLKHSNNFNAGVLLFRRSSWTKAFLQKVWNFSQRGGSFKGSEQDAMVTVLRNDGEFLPGETQTHLFMAQQSRLNSYPEEIPCIHHLDRAWHRGDWIIHFPVPPISNTPR